MLLVPLTGGTSLTAFLHFLKTVDILQSQPDRLLRYLSSAPSPFATLQHKMPGLFWLITETTTALDRWAIHHAGIDLDRLKENVDLLLVRGGRLLREGHFCGPSEFESRVVEFEDKLPRVRDPWVSLGEGRAALCGVDS